MSNETLSIIGNIIWTLTVIVVAVAEYRFGKKTGRREGYVDGHRHGIEDTLRQLGVPVKRGAESTLVIDVSRLVEEERLLVRGKRLPS